MSTSSLVPSALPVCRFGPLGRIKPDRRELLKAPRLSSFLASDFPTPPDVCDYRGGITDWGMLGNAKAGCCVESGILHTIMARKAVVTGKVISFTDDDAFSLYSAITGYDPATGANDNGTDMRTALEYWRITGVDGNKISAWCTVDPTNAAEVAIALYLFGPLLAGIDLTQAAENTFGTGKPWDYTWFTYVVGGHCTPISVIRPGLKTCQTWGADQDETDAFEVHQTEELYAVVDPDFVDATSGKSPSGLDMDGLLAASAKFAA
jgi:hypothetical protein